MPTVIRFPETRLTDSTGGKSLGLGADLLMMWVDSAVDRATTREVERFRAAAGTLDFPATMRAELKCLAVPEPRTQCPEPFTLPEAGNRKELAAKLTARGMTDLRVVEVVPLLSAERFRVRAFVHEVQVRPDELKVRRVYGALYDSRAPQALIDAKNPAALEAFWKEGTPARIEREASASAAELEQLLSLLDQKLPADRKDDRFWTSLQRIDALKTSGRIACRGTPCRDVRVLRDSGPRLWFTNIREMPGKGVVAASLDEISAKHSTNIFLMTVTLE
jgi:hypothetical protein